MVVAAGVGSLLEQLAICCFGPRVQFLPVELVHARNVWMVAHVSRMIRLDHDSKEFAVVVANMRTMIPVVLVGMLVMYGLRRLKCS
jgi:hypothetical protein